MSNSRIFDRIMALPDPDVVTVSKLTDPIGSDMHYSARTVLKLLDAQRRQFAKAVRALEKHPDKGNADGYMRALADAEAVIRGI